MCEKDVGPVSLDQEKGKHFALVEHLSKGCPPCRLDTGCVECIVPPAVEDGLKPSVLVTMSLLPGDTVATPTLVKGKHLIGAKSLEVWSIITVAGSMVAGR